MSVTATIKLSKEEVEKVILSLTVLVQIKVISDEDNNDIRAIEKLREDFIKIKNFIIEGEKEHLEKSKTQEDFYGTINNEDK